MEFFNDGKNVIINDDCLNQIEKLPEVDLIITDPPFNIGKKYNIYKDKKDDYFDWCFEWLEKSINKLKDGGSLYLFNYPENNAILFSFLNERLNFKRWLTWHYPTNTGMSPINYTRSQTSILFFSKGNDITFNKNDILVPYKNLNDKRIKKRIKEGNTGRVPYDVFIFNIVKNVNKEKTLHPCQLPIELLKIFIKASSNENEIVLDLFAGSCSVGVACKKLNRQSINIEIDKNYCEIGKERIKNTEQEIKFDIFEFLERG